MNAPPSVKKANAFVCPQQLWAHPTVCGLKVALLGSVTGFTGFTGFCRGSTGFCRGSTGFCRGSTGFCDCVQRRQHNSPQYIN